MFRNVAHIGIAVKDITLSKELFARLFGKPAGHEEVVSDQKVKTAMFRLGGTDVELLQGTSADSPITKFIEKRGEGIHHLSFVVENIEAELQRLKAEGFELVDERPRPGADNCLVAFLHPKSTSGVLIELSQKR